MLGKCVTRKSRALGLQPGSSASVWPSAKHCIARHTFVHVPKRSTGLARCRGTTASSIKPFNPREYYMRPEAPWPTDIPLKEHDLNKHTHVDLVVAGAGPAGVAVAERVAQAGFSVCVVDPNPLGVWPNNYGTWVDDFQAIGLEDCLEVVWPQARVWLNDTPEGAKVLHRPYGRIDRPALKKKLLTRCVEHGVTFLKAKVDGAVHANGWSTIKLSDGRSIRGTLVLDATGHSRTLVEFDQKFDPGYQGAYGIVAEVESHPFDLDTMVFMDWRDNHTGLGDPGMEARNAKLPTFLYCMPYSANRVFLEETSLVARPAIDFPELKARLDARLKFMGIKVTKIEEEEYCLIPMGGVLPKHPQRALAIGGTAGMVHPSTGFMMAKMLYAVPSTADSIIEQLAAPSDLAISTGSSQRPVRFGENQVEQMSAAVWRSTWPVERIRQRAFYVFGMEVLLKLNLAETRKFFSTFFALPDFLWHGFLSARLSFVQLILFGVSLFVASPNSVRGYLLFKSVPNLVVMLAELMNTVYDYYKTGYALIQPTAKAAMTVVPQPISAELKDAAGAGAKSGR